VTGRIALVALAAVALAFLVPQLLEERDLRRGRALAPAAATGDASRAALRAARRHSLTAEPRILEAQLLLFGGRPDDALAVVLPVARREPENLLAWRTVAAAARRRGDLTLQRETRERLAALDPRSAR
jgi:predicted Zn-dependent protease